MRIREVHLEEDAGKMIHAGDATLLDFNRTGTPLLEIVTQPDLEVGEEAEVFLQQLRRIVRWLGVCDGNMEEGSLRCDANVSVNLEGQGLGSKVEVKNLNSFKFVRNAVTYEIGRQVEILERGGTVTSETRLWNENRDVTESMRTKESSSDYRYFPEPDLPPFCPRPGVPSLGGGLPRRASPARRQRFIDSFGLSEDQAAFLCEEKADGRLVRAGRRPRRRPAERGAVDGLGREEAPEPHGPFPRRSARCHPQRFAELLALLAARSASTAGSPRRCSRPCSRRTRTRQRSSARRAGSRSPIPPCCGRTSPG